MRPTLSIACALTLLAPLAIADDLGMSGDKLVEPDCAAMSSWFDCRDIDTAPADVRRGYQYMHNTSRTLGPFGNTRYPDGSPYATAATACSSCHFTGGHVPFGTPVYQSPSKYQPDPITGLGLYFGPMGYYRDLEDSIIDCFRNCMNADRSPSKDDPVMRDLVAYIEWVADGITDPAMRENWKLLPPEAGPNLPVIAGLSTMRADRARGARLYRDRCSSCHDKDGAGRGEYRTSEGRPRVPALWGSRDGHSRAAAFYRNGVLGAYILTHMPLDKPNTLSAQQALDIASHINAPDKPRPSGLADGMYCFDDPDGIPATLRKPTDWIVGCIYPGEREHFEALGQNYDDMVRNGPWAALSEWRAQEIARLKAAQ